MSQLSAVSSIHWDCELPTTTEPALNTANSSSCGVTRRDSGSCWQVPVAGQATQLPQVSGLANDTIYGLYILQQDLRQPSPNL